MSDKDYTVRARDLLGTDDVALLDLDHYGLQIVKVSGLGEGDVWLQYKGDSEPRSVPAWGEVRVRPVN